MRPGPTLAGVWAERIKPGRPPSGHSTSRGGSRSGDIRGAGWMNAPPEAAPHLPLSRRHLDPQEAGGITAQDRASCQSVGRLGCFAGGCDYGKPTSSALGVIFTDPRANVLSGVPIGVRIYPTQIFESLASAAIFGILLWRFRRKKRDGEIFLLYMTLYAVARFFLEFLRGDPDRGFVFNNLLSTSQFIAIMILLAVMALVVYRRLHPVVTVEGPGVKSERKGAGSDPAPARTRLGTPATAPASKRAQH